MDRLDYRLVASIDAAFIRTRESTQQCSHRHGHEFRVHALGQLEALFLSINVGTIEAIPYHSIPFDQLNAVEDYGVIALFEALQSLAEWRLAHGDRVFITQSTLNSFDRVSSFAGNGTNFPKGNLSPAARRAILSSDERLSNPICMWRIFMGKTDIRVEGHGESFHIPIPENVRLNLTSNIWDVIPD